MLHPSRGSLFALIALTVGAFALPARTEARGFRVDTVNSYWGACDASNPCASLPTGLSINPLGSNPTAAPAFASSLGGPAVYVPSPDDPPDAQTPSSCESADCSQWNPTVSGLALRWNNASGTEIAQVMYFNLGTASSVGQTVYSPVLDSDGNAVTLGTIGISPVNGSVTTAWELEFNYDPNGAANGTAPTAASLYFDGMDYTASASTLSTSNLNEFVYFDGTLYAPSGWTASPVPLPASFPLLGSAIGIFLLIRSRGKLAAALQAFRFDGAATV